MQKSGIRRSKRAASKQGRHGEADPEAA